MDSMMHIQIRKWTNGQNTNGLSIGKNGQMDKAPPPFRGCGVHSSLPIHSLVPSQEVIKEAT